MNCTEEEASKLRCPMAFGKGLAHPVFCFGSECAWWEWTEWIMPEGFVYKCNQEGCENHKGKCGANK